MSRDYTNPYLAGTYHVNITRNPLDNEYTSSEKLIITSVKGVSGFENITMGDSPTTTTPTSQPTTSESTAPKDTPFPNIFLIILMAICGVLIMWRKRREY